MRLRNAKPTDEQLIWQKYQIDPETQQEWDYDKNHAEGVKPELVEFGLKMLQGRDINDINQVVYSMNTAMRRTKSGRRGVEVDSSFNYSALVEMKLETAIIKWKGIQDEKGQEVPPTKEHIGALPAWLQERLLETINDMSGLGLDIVGE